jgi:acyl-coenzyme A thioesterase PaaI-like protein
VVHGGILVAFADHTLGNIADTVSDGARHATIQLNTHFLATVEVGDFLELHAEVTRSTGTMAFLRGFVTVGENRVLAVGGIWRIFRPRK